MVCFAPGVTQPLWPWQISTYSGFFWGAICLAALAAAGALLYYAHWWPARLVLPMTVAFSGSVLTVHAESALKGVSLGGGAVHIDAIFSSSTSKSDGQSVASHEEKLVLTGVTAGGQPAAIDQTGIHIGGNSTSVKPLNDALASALGHAGITISALPSLGSVTSSGGQDVQSNVQGLLFTVAQYLPIPNATDTYFLTVTLGSSGTHLTASSERVGAPAAENGGIGGLETAGGTPAIPGTAGAFIPGTAGTPGSPAVNVPGTSTKRPRTAVLGNRGGLLEQLEADLVGAVISHRFDILYLSFTIAFIGVCLSSRLLVPRPRQAS